MKRKLTFKRITLFCILLVLIIIARPVGFLMYNYYKDPKPFKKEKNGYTNDASNLNETKIQTIIDVPEGIAEATAQIVQLIQQASREGKKISIAGAQHSMGGHTIYPGGIVLNMKGFHYMQIDSSKNVLRVGAGALWSEIIPYLDQHQRSVAVMQSNSSFSVGGSISVNCHGWQPNASPIASTVASFRLINAEGIIVTCSPQENAELFSLVLGGYGLFGVILDVELKLADNKMYTIQQRVIKSTDYITAFDEQVNKRKDIGMVYGRININPTHFMEEAILSTFTINDKKALVPLEKASYTALRRTVFRSSANSDYGKDLRWRSEKLLTSVMSGKSFSRNQLLSEGVETFQNTDTGYTDILHEYFIPKDSVVSFIRSLQKTIPAYKADLLNITLRNIKKDTVSFLRYANEEVFGFVMLFNQARDSSGEQEMQALTRKLVDIAIACKGTYYLPYRLHAGKEQFYTVYQQAKAFFALKKKYDPAEIFQNKFYVNYK